MGSGIGKRGAASEDTSGNGTAATREAKETKQHRQQQAVASGTTQVVVGVALVAEGSSVLCARCTADLSVVAYALVGCVVRHTVGDNKARSWDMG